MSFINLMANDIWSDADITRRTESMVRSEFSLEAETILNRKVVAMSIGEYQPTPADLVDMEKFRQVVENARMAGELARIDMALLSDTMAYEAAMRRLALPPIEGDEQDAAERSQAQALVDGAAPEVVELYELRNPPEPTPLPEEVTDEEVQGTAVGEAPPEELGGTPQDEPIQESIS